MADTNTNKYVTMVFQLLCRSALFKNRQVLLWFGMLLYLTIIVHYVVVGNYAQYRGQMYEVQKLTNKSNTARAKESNVNLTDINHVSVFEPQVRFVRNPKSVCHQGFRGHHTPYLLIQVHSACEHKAQRNAIRETWGHVLPHLVRLVFLLGVCHTNSQEDKVDREAKLYRDIVQLNYIESYKNLTMKSMAGLSWYLSQCSNANFLLKADDDSYVDTPRLLEYLRSLPADENSVYGYVNRRARVMRSGIWAVSPELYSADQYPDYCAGNGYVTTLRGANNLLRCHDLKSRPLLPIEDVYVTGLLAACAGTVLRHDARFPSWVSTPAVSTLRSLSQGSLFGLHGVDYARMYPIHQMLYNCTTCATDDWKLRSWFRTIKSTEPNL